ncbi:MAG TPA: inner membrane protein YhjD, partial [Pantoea sp.]|nr:inner membrane protein YhjD [Pantoea sp.]
MTDKQENPTSSEQPKPLIDIQTGNKTVDGSIRRVSRFAAWFQAIPAVAHFIRALERFNDRLGSQFGAAITYFSFLSLIPILMVSFAAVGFVLASNQDLLSELINKIVNSISDPTLATTLKNTVNTAIQQRATVGITGLLLALYSG